MEELGLHPEWAVNDEDDDDDAPRTLNVNLPSPNKTYIPKRF